MSEFTTALEPILSKIPEDEQRRPAVVGRRKTFPDARAAREGGGWGEEFPRRPRFDLPRFAGESPHKKDKIIKKGYLAAILFLFELQKIIAMAVVCS